ncbi:MAG: hypothetical protein ABUL41_01550 [Chitinophagaceae bacterium]
MKLNSSFSILFLITLLMSVSNSSAAGINTTSSVSKTKKMILISIESETTMNDQPQPLQPVTRQEEPVKKPHLQKTEELAHIHHFHKERVKKLKRHHKKFWLLSKVLLIVSHLLILVCAYMHLVHP